MARSSSKIPKNRTVPFIDLIKHISEIKKLNIQTILVLLSRFLWMMIAILKALNVLKMSDGLAITLIAVFFFFPYVLYWNKLISDSKIANRKSDLKYFYQSKLGRKRVYLVGSGLICYALILWENTFGFKCVLLTGLSIVLSEFLTFIVYKIFKPKRLVLMKGLIVNINESYESIEARSVKNINRSYDKLLIEGETKSMELDLKGFNKDVIERMIKNIKFFIKTNQMMSRLKNESSE